MGAIEDASLAYAAAVQRQAELTGKANAASAAADTASNVRTGLVARAAGGETVTAADLRAADEQARTAQAEADLALVIAGAATAAVDHAQVSMWGARAADHRSTALEAQASVVQAAADADKAVAAARAALAALHAKTAALADATRIAAGHDNEVMQAAPGNGALAAQHPSVWPRTFIRGMRSPPALVLELVRPNGQHREGTGEAVHRLLVDVQRGDWQAQQPVSLAVAAE